MDARKVGKSPLGPQGKEFLKRWHDTNVPRLMADARFRRALEALDNGTSPTPELAIERQFYVPLLASLAVAKTAKKESFEQLWAQDSGKTWKALTEFPERLRNLAKEIAKMNGSLFFSPGQLVGTRVPSNSIQDLVRRFSELPETLFYLANGVEVVAQELPVVTSEHYWRHAGHSPWIDQLSEFVGRNTGRFHDKEVAELLNAAEALLQPNKRGRNKGFDPQTLADFRSRRQKAART